MIKNRTIKNRMFFCTYQVSILQNAIHPLFSAGCRFSVWFCSFKGQGKAALLSIKVTSQRDRPHAWPRQSVELKVSDLINIF